MSVLGVEELILGMNAWVTARVNSRRNSFASSCGGDLESLGVSGVFNPRQSILEGFILDSGKRKVLLESLERGPESVCAGCS